MELGGIGFGTIPRGPDNGPGSAAAPAALFPGDPVVDQLSADSLESSRDVGTLAAYSGAFPFMPPGTVPAASGLGSAAMASTSGLAPSSPSSFTPARSWSSLSPQGGSDPDGSGASADRAMADLVDAGGDVFDSDS